MGPDGPAPGPEPLREPVRDDHPRARGTAQRAPLEPRQRRGLRLPGEGGGARAPNASRAPPYPRRRAVQVYFCVGKWENKFLNSI